MNHTFAIKPEGFELDGKPMRIISGAIHYFRVPREYWEDRLLKLKACGFNTVETYIAWNAHQPTEDEFIYDGMLDVCEFLRTAQRLGLWAIVRPGPYICSEWEFGALPWWLLKKPGIRLRCLNAPYMEAVDRFFDDLLPRLAPLQLTRGGNILMMQVENEYGSYGDDKPYLTALAEGMRRRGIEVPLFTSDGATDFMLTGGTLPGIHKTANFGSRAGEQFDKLREFQPDGPLMCCEFWNGWFDHWTEKHHTRDPQEAADALRDILSRGASVSAYMFHGGTNFGFMNGANGYETYEPTVNSYDDDAPVDENGALTPKYHLFREVIAEFAGAPDTEPPAPIPTRRYGEVAFTECARLYDNLDALSAPVHSAAPLTMEELDLGYGFVLYRTHVAGPREELPVVLQDVHDRAHIYVNGELRGIQYRNNAEPQVKLAVPREGCDLDILVENMGRINYGYHLLDRKGITEGIRLGQAFVYQWDNYPLGLTDLSGVRFERKAPAFDGTPLFMRATLDVDEPCDTFIKLPGFKKGVIFVNGRILSRYWEVGPQHSAYLPAPFMRKGENEIIVLELDGFDKPVAVLDDTPELA
ncbi:MAG: beta-galactosidase family protein [Candidatus Fimadaptatus sp.]